MITLLIATAELSGNAVAAAKNAAKQLFPAFSNCLVEKQIEYLPLLNPWFIEEHREKVENLQKYAAEENSAQN